MDGFSAKRPRRNLTITLLVVVLLCSPLAAQNGITANESGTIGGAANVDALWGDSTDHRWKMNNDANSGTGGVDVAIWACPTQLGGIVYAGAAVSGIDTESCLLLVSTPGVPLLAGSSAPQWGGSSTVSLDLQNWAVVAEVLNETGTGTVVNTLAKITSTSTTGAIQAGTSDTAVPTYVVLASAGKTGNAQLALSGQANCKMDATNGSGVEGQPVFASITTAGDCSTASLASVPVGTWIVGQMISNSTTAGSTALILVQPGYRTIGTSTTNNYASGATLTLAATNTAASAATTISNANSTNNNASNALLVKTTGTSTGAVPLIVDQSGTSSTGNIANFQTNDTNVVTLNQGGFWSSPMTTRVTADQTVSATTLGSGAISGLAFTLPSIPTAQSYSFRCDGMYSEAATLGVMTLGVQVSSAPNNWTIMGGLVSSNTGVKTTAVTDSVSTSATQLVQNTPGAANAAFPFYVYGTVENKANTSNTISILMTITATDGNGTVYRGSYCAITP